MAYPVQKTDAEWREELDPQRYHVLREAGTERPFTNEYWKHDEVGTYKCAACGIALFTDVEKFESSCGWPAFYQAVEGGRVEEHTDMSFGMRRVEVRCSNCGSHLGHVFNDSPHVPTGLRYCINSASLVFDPGEKSA
ncbi:peptide-methionine (R)-S-oxide reductase [bacterium]|nr:MAG: peptide-methionine (R)-S-oxide reductase [bacterium]